MKIHKISVVVFAVVFTLCLAGPNVASAAATSPTFGAAASYSVLSGAGATNTGITSISGDLGVSPATSYTESGTTNFTLPSNPHYPPASDAAHGDNLVVYGELSAGDNATCDSTHSIGFGGSTDLAGKTLPPGVYCADVFSLSGKLTLDDTGAPDGVWIFRSAGALNTSSGPGVASIVFKTGVGLACNVWWKVVSSATIGTYTAFIGNILASTAVALQTGATLDGRAFAYTAAVTLDANTITGPTCTHPPAPTCALTAAPTSMTTGNSSVLSWTTTNATALSIDHGINSVTPVALGSTSVSPTVTTTYTGTVTGAGGTGTCTALVTVTAAPLAPTCTLTANPTAITTGNSSVLSWTTTNATSFSIDNSVGAVTPVASGSSSVSPVTTILYTGTATGTGGSVQCAATVTPTPLPVSSGRSGSNYFALLPPLISVTKIPNPLALPSGAGEVTYTYSVTNLGVPPMTGVTVVDNKCPSVVFVSGDTNNNSQLDPNETWTYRCTTTLAQTTTNAVTATGHANGFTAVDVANATVVVGMPVVPPLIHLVKKPNAFTLPAGGGAVTYTYTVTNPGTAPLSNVSITDDKCTGLPGRVSGHPGDLNKNDLLESNETWSFTCKTKITQTTTNTGTAEGHANGLTAYDFSPATVVVAPPKLPNTGFPPEQKSTSWYTALLSLLRDWHFF